MIESLKNQADEVLIKHFITTRKKIYFVEVWERYVNKIYAKCLSMTHNKEDAQDYTHDIFFKIYINIHSFKFESQFSTWVFAITHNFCINSLKKKKINYNNLNTNDLEVIDENIDDGNKTENLNNVIQHLTPEEKLLIKLKYEKGLKINDISKNLNISESAIKMRLNRTKSKIKEILKLKYIWILLMITN